MTLHDATRMPQGREDTTGAILKLAVLAVGGQGGGVLTNWIIDLAQRAGYRAQATSVAGVAQRTGSTIYYVEMTPDTGREPVFSLSPAPGDVDILIAAELMEAGRAMMRGFVTPDRTTLIASTHRVLATTEKVVPGDGRVDAAPVIDEARKAAHRAICLDLESAAVQAGSVISASLFGALAGSGALPFARTLYEDTIRASGRGVQASLRAFEAGFDGAAGKGTTQAEPDMPATGFGPKDAPVPIIGMPRVAPAPDAGAAPTGPDAQLAEWRKLAARIDALPAPVRDMAQRGLAKVVDYQDVAYGAQYLDLLDRAVSGDSAEQDWTFTGEAAKYLANALCYDDLIRVADLKTRASREARLRREQGVDADAIVQVTEYFHPRAQETVGTMPAALGRWMERSAGRMAWLDRRVNKGRRLRTDSMRGFLQLWLVSSLKPWRRRLLRHAQEMPHIHDWFDLALRERAGDYRLGVEILRCRRLIKGYSDTHARGQSKFDRVLGGLDMLRGREDAADWLRRLRDAALKDEDGDALNGALRTIASF